MIFKNRFLITMILIVIVTTSLIALDATKDFIYDIRVINPNPILCEPIGVFTTITYNGNYPIDVLDNPEEIIINNEKMHFDICSKAPTVDKSPLLPGKFTIKPGGTIKTGYNLRCYPPFWKPGKFDVRFEKKFNDIVYKSSSFTIILSEPTGIDKKLFDAAKERNMPDMKSCQKDKFGDCKKDLWSPCTDSGDTGRCFNEKMSWEEMLDNYPTSCYTAWIPSSSISEYTFDDPRITVKFIKANKYWDGNSIYDPKAKGYFKRLDGPDYDKWKREKILEILRYCPRFPRKDGLIVTAAISNIVLGNEKEGIEMLKKLINESNSREAAWAKQFLEEWEKQKPRQ